MASNAHVSPHKSNTGKSNAARGNGRRPPSLAFTPLVVVVVDVDVDLVHAHVTVETDVGRVRRAVANRAEALVAEGVRWGP